MSTYYQGTELAWDVGNIGDETEKVKEVTVTGAVLGDFVKVSASLDMIDLVISGQVTASDTVTVTLSNVTSGTLDIGTIDLTVLVTSKSGLHVA